ncbi:MAG TPA: hypothetical protein VEA44_15715 [Caulobacter sp.]|nr:hypothetical protein [Caulobacter sp.]
MGRYDGKPLLQLVEMYILQKIGRLEPERARRMAEMAPKLSATFKIDGTWDQIIEGVLRLPPDYGDRVKGHWEAFLAAEIKAGRKWIDPEAYARDFADRNILPDPPR